MKKSAPTPEVKAAFINAASSGDIAVIEKYLKQGVAPPRGALYFASLNGRERIVERLLGTIAATSDEAGKSLCAALENKHQDIAIRIIAAGVDANSKDGLLQTPVLVLAAERGLTDSVQRLLHAGADPNSHDVPVGAKLFGESVGRTALMAAAVRGRSSVVRLPARVGTPLSVSIGGMCPQDPGRTICRNCRSSECFGQTVARLLFVCRARRWGPIRAFCKSACQRSSVQVLVGMRRNLESGYCID